jgi:elongation factor Tu
LGAARRIAVRALSRARNNAPVKKVLERRKPHCNVGTIGHVGHGKTTLAAALSLVLQRYNQRTSDFPIAPRDYRWLTRAGLATESDHRGTTTPRHLEYETAHRHYAHVDCPGLARFATNAVVGLAQMDAAIVVVSALESVMAQTREHVLIARHLGLSQLVVFINFCDLQADAALVDLVELEVRELLTRMGFDGDATPVVRGSALGATQGEERWQGAILALADALDEHITLRSRDDEAPFALSVQSAFYAPRFGAAATGRVRRGSVRVGALVELVGMSFDETTCAAVTSVETFGHRLSVASAGELVGVSLKDVVRYDLRRGIVLAAPGSIVARRALVADVSLVAPEDGGPTRPIVDRFQSQLVCESASVGCSHRRCDGGGPWQPSTSARVELELSRPIAIEPGARFVLREGNRTFALGVALDDRS